MRLWMVISLLLVGTSVVAFPRKASLIRRAVPGEYVAIVKNRHVEGVKNFFKKNRLNRTVQSFKNLNSNQKISIVKFKANSSIATSLKDSNMVEVIGPNYVYSGEAREQSYSARDGRLSGGGSGKIKYLPNDALIKSQEHHFIINSPFVWKKKVKGSPKVIVAVTDDGVDISHPDLINSIWINQKEIPGNGIDDDGNGYIDDVKGWDFTDLDNDPQGGSHGTHVAGIIGSTINNKIGVVGTAAGVKIMPLRWYGGRKSWTTDIIVEAYAYAMNNGARIINTSYNIDWLTSDKVYREMVRILKQNNVLLFNSAGNSNIKNPKRQAIEELTLVASTYGRLLPKNRLDTKSDFSNHGTGIDISAPGEKILATCLGSKYCEKSGTSMASPNAAAVAAMIWSVYPGLNAEQVLHKLFTSSDNIDKFNQSYTGLLGVGRINVAKAISRIWKPVSLEAGAYNKHNGEFIYKVRGRLNPRYIPRYIQISVNNNPVLAQLSYRKNNLRVKVANHLLPGNYEVLLNPAMLIDVFGKPASLTDKLIHFFRLK